MRRREISHTSPQMLALENALDLMPDPEAMTPEERRRALAVLSKVSEVATQRMVAAHVQLWMDEHRASLPHNFGTTKAS